MEKSIQSIPRIQGIIVAVVVCFTCILTTPPAQAAPVDPNQSSFHLFGAVFNPTWTASDRHIWQVYNYATAQTTRLDCFPTETSGCELVQIGHWVIVDGYLASEGWCFDGPCNILRVTKAMAWDAVTGSWYQIAGPK